MNANNNISDKFNVREITKKLRASSLKDWSDDFNMEFGKSVCNCCICHDTFIGFKHRVICKECGDKLTMSTLK